MLRNVLRHACARGSLQSKRTIPAQRRFMKLSAPQLAAAKGWGTLVNIIGGAYIGGLLICGGSLYFMYQDANERQNIPFSIGFANQVTAVKAINKDDVLKSPRYAVKHYRRLLIELAKKENPELVFDEENGENKYDVPILDSATLLGKKSSSFSNFYIDIVMRYANALLAKGELDIPLKVLQKIVGDPDIFYHLGNAERLSQCCRLLSKVCPDDSDKEAYLKRTLDMLRKTYTSVTMDENYTISKDSRVSNELILCLNNLAFVYAKHSKKVGAKHDKEDYLNRALNIYLANLQSLCNVESHLEADPGVQRLHPLFNCDEENLKLLTAEIKAHISEIMWAKGFKKSAVAWSEEVIESIYFDYNSSPKVSPILIAVLSNLTNMYTELEDLKSVSRCKKLKDEILVFDAPTISWYDSVISRFSKIIYKSGPLGIIQKSLSERFGKPNRVLDLEEFENEDEE